MKRIIREIGLLILGNVGGLAIWLILAAIVATPYLLGLSIYFVIAPIFGNSGPAVGGIIIFACVATSFALLRKLPALILWITKDGGQ